MSQALLTKRNRKPKYYLTSCMNSFHLCCFRRMLRITWMDRNPNTNVLERAKCSSIHALLSQRRLRWLGHICRMGKGRIAKDLLYGELDRGTRKTGCPLLRFKDVCKRDMKSAAIDIESWELMVKDRSTWWHYSVFWVFVSASHYIQGVSKKCIHNFNDYKVCIY